MSRMYPYADRFPVNRGLPATGRDKDEVLAELRELAVAEDAAWETGRCSGSMYCGDHEHYDYLNEVFGLFSHMNALQRDMCPSATRFEGEIIAMALDLMHGDAATARGHQIGGMVTSGGSASIMHALLAYRDHAAQTRGITTPNVVKPETSHPAFDKGCHLFGIEVRNVPVPVDTAVVDPAAMRAAVDGNTIALVGSACNYGWGTVDPIAELGELAADLDIGLLVDGCLGGFLLPFGEELGYDQIPVFDFRIPGVTSISADTHKYGYALKGTSTLLFRDVEVRNSQYFYRTDWSGGVYCSPGMDGSRSEGLLAATWASMVRLGREGYLNYARQVFDAAFGMQAAIRSHPELTMIGDPTFCFAFTSTVGPDDGGFDVYHVNDFMKERGWRFNGLQLPNALHFAATRPQTQDGVVESFTTDLADAVAYAVAQGSAPPKSGSAYAGASPADMPGEMISAIEAGMASFMDRCQGLPRES